MRTVEYNLVDRPFGTPPLYSAYDFEQPGDARLVTPHREPVRPTQLEFDYVLDQHTINVRSRTPCPDNCVVCKNEGLHRHDNSLFPERPFHG